MAQMGQMARPGADYVALATQLHTLPAEQLLSLAGQGGPTGDVAKWVIRDRTQRAGLGTMLDPRAREFQSSLPQSDVLRRVQGVDPNDPTGQPGGAASLTPPPPPAPLAAQPAPQGDQMGLAAQGAPPPMSPPQQAPPPPAGAPATGQDIGIPAVARPPQTDTSGPPASPDDTAASDKGLALMQAGLAIMASRNPSVLGAIGEGGMVGLQNYAATRRERNLTNREEKKLAAEQARADQQYARLTAHDEQQQTMAEQRMELERQLALQKQALAREEMDITRQRYDPSNPMNAANIEQSRAAAAASRAAAAAAGRNNEESATPWGNGTQARAVYALVKKGKLTEDQADNYMASTKVPGPNGEVGLMTPTGLQQIRAPDLSNQEKKAIDEADTKQAAGDAALANLQAALALNNKAFSGPLAPALTKFDQVVPGEWGGTATSDYENLIKTGAMANLKNFFGGNPSEGERKVLLDDLAASVTKSPDARRHILERGIATVQKQKERDTAKAAALREGTYYKEGLPETPQAATGKAAASPDNDPMGLR